MQAIPDSTQSDALSTDKKEKKKKANKKKKRKAESRDSKIVKKKKTSKGKSKSSAKSKDKRHKSTNADEVGDPDLDLSAELKPIGDYIKDREDMLEQMFHCIQQDRLTTMLPNILKNVPLEEVKALCLTELEGMSKKRIRYILAGREMDSSSGTEESDSENEAPNNDEGSSSPQNQVPHSTVNLQVSDNQSERSIESEGAGHRSSADELEYEAEEELVYQESGQEYAEEEMEDEMEAGYHSDEMEAEADEAPIYDEDEEGEEVMQDDMEDQYEEQNDVEETEYINEEELEQQEDDDIVQRSSSSSEDIEDEGNSGPEDVGEQASHDDENQQVEEEVEAEGVEAEEEEPTIEIDVPKRMRKDVDEGDIEDGEVFDDDEEEKELSQKERQKDDNEDMSEKAAGQVESLEKVEESPRKEREQFENEEMSERAVLQRDGQVESLEKAVLLKDEGVIKTGQLEHGEGIDMDAESVPNECSTSEDKSSENELFEQGHEENREVMNSGESSIDDELDQGNLDIVVDSGKEVTSEHGREGDVDHVDTMEQGKEEAMDHGKVDTLEQGKVDTGDHGKQGSSEQGEDGFCEQFNRDFGESDEGDELPGTEGALDHYNQDTDTVEIVQENTNEDGVVESLDKITTGVGESDESTLEKDESVQERGQVSDLGGHSDQMRDDAADNGAQDPSVGSKERTSGAANRRDFQQTYKEEPVVAMEISIKPVSGGGKDDGGIFGDSNRESDNKEAGEHVEPGSSDPAMICTVTSQGLESTATVVNVVKEIANDSKIGEDSDTEKGGKDAAEKVDSGQDDESDSSSVSDSDTDSDSGNSESEEEVGAKSEVPPATDELEMLELELRARAIRSLMKKMGKE